MRTLRGWALALPLLTLVGCYHPRLREGLACDRGACPATQTCCADDVCRATCEIDAATPPPDAAVAPTRWSRVAAGDLHTCAIREGDGAMFCWGWNGDGQLGVDSPRAPIGKPTAVPGVGSPWVDVAAGRGHTCGVTQDGRLFCWGADNLGQLGNGADGPSATPVEIPSGFGGWTDVAAAGDTTCAVDGPVQCWGATFGEAGELPVAVTQPAVLVGGSTGSLAVAPDHACVVSTSLYCWGRNDQGQVGGAPSGVVAPTIVAGEGITGLALGDGYTCYTAANGLTCYGDNDQGQSDPTNANTWQVGPSLLGSYVPPISAGRAHTCATGSDGSLTCWGWNTSGELGRGDVALWAGAASQPAAGSPWTDVATGKRHTCGIHDGALACWGSNAAGQLGNGEVSSRNAPTRVGTGTWTAVSAGDDFTCGISQGALYCWGDDSFAKLGLPAFGLESAGTPQQIDPGPWSAIATGREHACGIDAGVAKCWGRNLVGEAGACDADGDCDQLQQSLATLGSGFQGIAVGDRHSCAFQATTVLCWGANEHSQLGNNSTMPSFAPVVAMSAAIGISSISLGDQHGCAVDHDNITYCWGDGSRGRLGSSSSADVRVGTNIGTSFDTSGLALRADQSCLIDALDGTLHCFGGNDGGELGPSGTTVTAPTTFGASGRLVGLGDAFGTAKMPGLARSVWGTDTLGDFGRGGEAWAASRLAPTNVVGESQVWTQLAAGRAHACGIDDAGALYCWGSNEGGALGLGDAWQTSPVAVGEP